MSEIPLICEIACPLRSRYPELKARGIVPSAKCDDPGISEGPTHDRAVIYDGGHVDLEAFGSDGIGELVCRNQGIYDTIDRLASENPDQES